MCLFRKRTVAVQAEMCPLKLTPFPEDPKDKQAEGAVAQGEDGEANEGLQST